MKAFNLNDYIEICNKYSSIGVYRHYKGGEYIFECISIRESDKQPFVNYSSIKEGVVWSRPIDEFFGNVNTPNGIVKRFEKLK